MHLNLQVKRFSFTLKKILYTSKGCIREKKGWLLLLTNKDGDYGWGEVSPFNQLELEECDLILQRIGNNLSRDMILNNLNIWPNSLSFGFGAAIGELEGTIGDKTQIGWLNAPKSAVLLNSKEDVISQIKYHINNIGGNLTFKWKIGVNSNADEEILIQKILNILPNNMRLRLDPNCSWEFSQAKDWSKRLQSDKRIEWIEQPLPPDNIEELEELSRIIPIALDESLIQYPSLRESWKHWQIRKPLIEGDPRKLLEELMLGTTYKVLSTSFETGIGARWINHLAALQQRTPTPVAPGLASGWYPTSNLFSNNPELVWKAA